MTDDAYRQLMKHAHRLAMDGHGELAHGSWCAAPPAVQQTEPVAVVPRNPSQELFDKVVNALRQVQSACEYVSDYEAAVDSVRDTVRTALEGVK